jgi:NADH:ubiquinone oxidoreductase subunit 5 (subunit L)/multisubunit Na+/H+ antiporter MnhA subunit
MLNYLYYKLYRAALKSSVKDIPVIAAAAWFSALIAANVLVVSGFLSKIISLPFVFANPKQGGWFTGILIVLVMLYYKKDKRESILEKYSQESNEERKKGNAIVAVYVALSFLLIFAVAFFRPGKL